MTVGMFIAAASVYYFLMPSNLVVGSITGLSMVISSVFNAMGLPVKVSLVVTVINAILLVLAWLLIGAEFGAKTVYTALILGPFIELWEKILPYKKLIEPGQTSVMGTPGSTFCALCSFSAPRKPSCSISMPLRAGWISWPRL